MRRFRIGNDRTVMWSITRRNDKNEEGNNFSLAGKEVRLFYTNARGRFEAKNIEIQEDNVIAWTFLGKDQKVLGSYTLTVEIKSNGMRTIKRDISEAFVLVARSCEDNSYQGDAIIDDADVITLATELDIYSISPIIPTIGDNGNWFVDGEDTHRPSRGEKGDVVDAAYMEFCVEEDMNLYLSFLSTNDQLELDFNVNEDGYLTVDK